jgi:hypothetical protein
MMETPTWIANARGLDEAGNYLVAVTDPSNMDAVRRSRLIEAAPVMLAALRRVGCQFYACPGPNKPFQDMATCFVCEAIAKAEG